MSRKRQSRGICSYCGREIAKGGMRRHLMACPERQAVIAAAEQGPGRTETLFHLQVEDAWRGDYWLHLEMRGSATLDTLDRYLRAIWLECCGHLSRFSIRGWGSPDIPMSRRAKEVFAPGRTFIHQYDFGTTSETRIKVLSSRQGKPTTGHPIALMARNVPPEIPCIECGRPARWLCVECLVVEGVFGALCDEHATTHPHKEYGEPLPLVNSPRMGMCGYRGPAEPPY